MAHLTETFIFKDLYKIRWGKLGGGESAPPVIMNHGTPFSSLYWVPFARALSFHYCVYLFDLAGFGESQDTVTEQSEEVDVSLALQGELFAALYAHWGFSSSKPAHIVAHDIGGHTALRAHVLLGCQYASLCLLDPVAVTPWGSPFMRLVMSNVKVFEGVPPGIFKGMLREYIQSAAYKKLPEDKMEELAGPWLSRGAKGQKNFFRQIACASPKHTEEQEIYYSRVMESEEGSPKKLKIIWAEDDQWIPIARGEKLAGSTDAPEFISISNAGHLIMVDQPERTMYEISCWLDKMRILR